MIKSLFNIIFFRLCQSCVFQWNLILSFKKRLIISLDLQGLYFLLLYEVHNQYGVVSFEETGIIKKVVQKFNLLWFSFFSVCFKKKFSIQYSYDFIDASITLSFVEQWITLLCFLNVFGTSSTQLVLPFLSKTGSSRRPWFVLSCPQAKFFVEKYNIYYIFQSLFVSEISIKVFKYSSPLFASNRLVLRVELWIKSEKSPVNVWKVLFFLVLLTIHTC